MRAAWILLLAAALAAPVAARGDDPVEQEYPDPDWWHVEDPDWWAEPDSDWWGAPELEAAEAEDPREAARSAALAAPSQAESAADGDGEEFEEDEELARHRRAYNECQQLPRQIQRFKAVDLKLARERGDEVWEEATQLHITRLEARFEERCAEPDDTAARVVAAMIRNLVKLGQLAWTAAKIAAMF